MRPGYSPEVFKTCLEKEFHRCNSIKEEPDCKNSEKAVIGQVFVKKIKIIPEIQVGFSPRCLWQGAAADMKNS